MARSPRPRTCVRACWDRGQQPHAPAGAQVRGGHDRRVRLCVAGARAARHLAQPQARLQPVDTTRRGQRDAAALGSLGAPGARPRSAAASQASHRRCCAGSVPACIRMRVAWRLRNASPWLLLGARARPARVPRLCARCGTSRASLLCIGAPSAGHNCALGGGARTRACPPQPPRSRPRRARACRSSRCCSRAC